MPRTPILLRTLLIGSILVAACHKGETTAPVAAVATVAVTPASDTVTAGQTLQLTVTMHDEQNNVIIGRVVTWASSDTTVAKVSGTGLVTGVAAGTATVTATSEGKNGTAAFVVLPVVVPPGPTFTSVSAGFVHSCGITIGGATDCWGNNQSGQLGNATTTSSATPVAVTGGLTFTRVSAGYSHTCAVTQGSAAYCWGSNQSGELGNGAPTTSSSTPVAVAGGLTFASVSAGRSHTCAVTSGGQAYCWGSNQSGDLGNGATGGSTATPVAVSGGLTFKSVSAGSVYTCGVTTAGAAYCWGGNGFGTLGDGTTTDRSTPVAVAGGLNFASVTTGANHACGVTTGGAAYCWGEGVNGQLGNGLMTVSSSTPVAVVSGLTFTSVSAGDIHTCGVTTAGAAYCWGDNSFGNLGNAATSSPSATPLAVTGALTFTTLSAGTGFHTCGLTTAGAGYCWGYNDSGELGNGTTGGYSATPVKVIGSSP